MIGIKVDDNKATPMIGNKIAYNHKWKDIKEENMDIVERYVENGRDIKIKVDGKVIDGKEYFKEEEEESEYAELFDDHYTKRVKNIKEFTDDLEILNEILTYAKKKDEPKSVIEDIEEYIDDLK